MAPFQTLPAFDPETGQINAIIETPQGSRNKYKFDEKTGLFKLSAVLTAGASFPYDFGYIPSTRAADGDPLDLLLLLDEPVFAGCLVAARLIGVIEARQTEPGGKPQRNDRLIGVAARGQLFEKVRTLRSLNPSLLDQIEHFFITYTTMQGKTFRPLARRGPSQALRHVHEAAQRFRAEQKPQG